MIVLSAVRRSRNNRVLFRPAAWPIAVFSVICVAGCHPLPPGQLAALPDAAATTRRGNVCLIRGWSDLWSEGIDQLAAKLRLAGVRATVFREEQWPALAEELRMRYSTELVREPLILIGFSYGADDALRIARELERSRETVDLVVTIDPVTPPPVPPNVRRCYNLFQTNGVWDVFPWLRGIPLRQQEGGTGALANVDIRRDRRDLLEPNTSHATIAANPKVHDEIVRQVIAVCPLR